MENKKYYKNYSYLIEQDNFAKNPDIYSDDLFLVYDHRDFCVERKEFYPPEINDYLNGDTDYDFSNFWIFPVYAYIHSGVSLSLSHNGDRWDTSMRGYVLVNKNIREDFNEELAKNYAEDLIKEWNMYLSGDVYELEIYKFDICDHCGHKEETLIQFITGIYGYDEAEQLAKEYIDNYE